MELAALCASHMDSMERFDYFDKMLRSWFPNNVPLYVSMSKTEGLEIEEALQRYRSNYPLLTIVTHAEKKSQFHHYLHLLSMLPSRTSHLIFTDDDDIWHKKRVEKVRNTPFTDVLRLPHLDFEEGRISETIYAEHWDYCVPISTLREFLLRSANLEHRYADVCFVKHIETKHTVTEVTHGWYYVWRRHIRTLYICPTSYERLLEDLNSGVMIDILVATAANAISRNEFVTDFLREFHTYSGVKRDMWMETLVQRKLSSIFDNDSKLQSLVQG
jgi:hypothetical protein